MVNKNSARQKIEQLVQRFSEQLESYNKSDYNETQTRRDFIDPFFKALGWDMDNENGYAESYREVIHEDRLRVGESTRAPDYSFRLVGGKRLFFVEAKKPSVSVKDDIQPAYQIRRYGWSAKMPISIITDFQEFAVYDCTRKPRPDDKASVARIKYLTYKDYLTEFDFIWEAFSKDQVLKGSFDRFVRSDTHKRGTTTVDHEFLQSLDSWRTYLATSVSWNNKEASEDDINFAVQQTIDRIIFLRIAEDRGVEHYGNLKSALKQGDFYSNLFHLFENADARYNSGLFDFNKDKITKSLKIDNKVIKNIINELYYPECPYEFSVLPVEILGSAYEQFLGKQIRIDKAHRATIEVKPEVRKAGGVYYTPQYIVDYIVANTVGKLIDGKTPSEVSEIKIVDPACGSGSFLLGAYQYLLNWHKDYYSKSGTLRKVDDLTTTRVKESKGHKRDLLTPEGNLTTAEKKRILLNNIYGVDIDVNAVEVTKLSLLLKCMEGETEASINSQLRLFNERVLPTLDDNIKSGNSLVDEDFYAGELDFGEERKVKPFNWQRAFPGVFNIKTTDPEPKARLRRALHSAMKADEELLYAMKEYDNRLDDPDKSYGRIGFDVVIGNPPYVRQELLGLQKMYFQNKYRVYHGMADLYSYFIERGIQLLKPDGLFGMIVANKWMRANYGEPLRKFLKEQSIHEIIDFGDLPVFESATTYPCIVIAGKPEKSNKKFRLTIAKTLQFESLSEYVTNNFSVLKKESLDDKGWNLAGEDEQKLLKKIHSAGIPLGEYVNGHIYYGIKTGLNEAFVIEKDTRQKLIEEDPRSAEIIKPFLAGRDIKRYQPSLCDRYLILFPKGFTNNYGNKPRNAWKWLHENYPAIAKHLTPFKTRGEKRSDKGEFWWELRACDYYDDFAKPKIILPDISVRMQATFDNNKSFCANTSYFIPTDDKFLLAILNSKLVFHYYSSISTSIRGGYLRFIRQYLITIPIKKEDCVAIEMVKLVDQLLQLNRKIVETKLPNQIEQLQSKIAYVDKWIDELVYRLYDLTPEEIAIIEKSGTQE